MSPDVTPLDSTIVAARLAADWGLRSVTLTTHDGGMNSQTWFVATEDARYVAKAVPAARRASFDAGLAAATIVETAGIPAGAPVPTLAGAISVEVEARNGRAHVSVSDTGPGLSAEEARGVFDRYRHGPRGGYGLGLYVCRRIIELHGGQISVTSTPMHGARFVFDLSLAP